MIRITSFALVALCWLFMPAMAQVTKQTSPAGHDYAHFAIGDADRFAITIIVQSPAEISTDRQWVVPHLTVEMLRAAAGDDVSVAWVAGEIRTTVTVGPGDVSVAEVNRLFRGQSLSADTLAAARATLSKRMTKDLSAHRNIVRDLSRRVLSSTEKRLAVLQAFSASDLTDIELSEVRDWHATAFATANMTIASAGSSKFEQIGRAVDLALDGLPKGESAEDPVSSDIAIPQKRIVLHLPDAKTSYIYTIAPIPSAKEGTDLQLNLAAGVLGFSEQSRLFGAITAGDDAREGFRSGLDRLLRGRRVLRMSGEVETQLVSNALAEMEDAYEEFRDGGIGFIEFPFARGVYEGRVEASLEKPERSSFLLADSMLNGLPADDLPTMAERVGDLSRGDVNAFIGKVFPPFEEMLQIVITSDPEAIEDACVIKGGEEIETCLE